MRLFMKYRNQGLVKTAKARDWDKVFDLVLKDARQQWPDAAWRAATVSTKFGNEKTRYRQWAAFYHHPGVSYNPVTGLLEIDREETWTSFLTRNRVSEKSCAWLRSIPLGDAKVYRAVYRESNADGAKVVNADKHVRPHARPAGAGAVPESSRAATGLQHKRKLTHDSNHQTKRSRPAPRGDSSMSDSSSDSQASASGKRSLQDDISTAVELLADGMNALANPRLPSAPALFTEAVTDLYQWRHNITPQQLLLCAKKMENLANARVWILLNDDTVRRELVDQWTKDA
ncbi:hypothetical protein SEPCBS119000_005996 [Sporothrix epigloea]|uniref:Myb/SANT-like domain-containing protein n=1 Tax=Sporothrix epigloea TaxID=1892477 RepID=A0ABP0E0K9_9PEZI